MHAELPDIHSQSRGNWASISLQHQTLKFWLILELIGAYPGSPRLRPSGSLILVPWSKVGAPEVFLCLLMLKWRPIRHVDLSFSFFCPFLSLFFPLFFFSFPFLFLFFCAPLVTRGAEAPKPPQDTPLHYLYNVMHPVISIFFKVFDTDFVFSMKNFLFLCCNWSKLYIENTRNLDHFYRIILSRLILGR